MVWGERTRNAESVSNPCSGAYAHGHRRLWNQTCWAPLSIHVLKDCLACNKVWYWCLCIKGHWNKYLQHVPTKPQGQKRFPRKLLWGNVSFMELESCNIILTTPPFGLATAFWATKNTKHFRVCAKTLKEDLELIELNYHVMANLVVQVKISQKTSSNLRKERTPSVSLISQSLWRPSLRIRNWVQKSVSRGPTRKTKLLREVWEVESLLNLSMPLEELDVIVNSTSINLWLFECSLLVLLLAVLPI